MKNKSLSNNEGACWTLCVIGLQVIRSTIPDTPKSQIDWHKNNKTSQIKSRYTKIIPSEQESMLVFAVEHFKVNWNVRPYCVQTKWIKKIWLGTVCVCVRERKRPQVRKKSRFQLPDCTTIIILFSLQSIHITLYFLFIHFFSSSFSLFYVHVWFAATRCCHRHQTEQKETGR